MFPSNGAPDLCKLPDGFTQLSVLQPDTSLNRIYNVVGVVVERDTPRQARGGKQEWFITFSICDASRPSPLDAVKVRIFWPDADCLPDFNPISSCEVILLRSVKFFRMQSEYILLSNNQFDKFAYILARPPVVPGGPPVFAKTQFPRKTILKSEADYIGSLRKWWVKNNVNTLDVVQSQQSTTVSSRYKNARGPRPALIKELQFDRFYEVVGEIVKIFDDGRATSLFITDYTENPNIYNYEWGKYKDSYTQESAWQGPFGRYTLQVSLWDQNRDAAQSLLHEGQYVCLTNMRAKANKSQLLEGSVHGDTVYPDKIDFRVLLGLDTRIQAIEERKRAYEHRFNRNREKYEAVLSQHIAEQERQQSRAPSQNREMTDTPSDECSGSESSSAPKRTERKSSKDASTEPRGKSRRRREGSLTESSVPINNKIRSENPSLPTTSISEIRSLSPDHYVNNKYRILIRVVDFLPAKLEDFATYGTPPDEPDSDEEYDTNEMYGKKKKIWMWRFAFLVEDKAGDRMMVIVSGKEAECLLKFEATDLRNDHQALNTLRQKLANVWGNLYDIKHPKRKRPQPPHPEQSGSKKRKRKRRKDKGRHKDDCEADDADNASDGEPQKDEEEEMKEKDAKYFYACVQEYGVYGNNKKFNRKWKLFGTTMH